MLKKIITISTIVGLCLLIALLNITTPVSAGPFGVLAFFVLSYIISLGVITYLVYGVSYLVAQIAKFLRLKAPYEPLTLKRSYYYSTVLAAAPVLMLGLQSVGSVGLYEFALVAIFVAVGCLYVLKRTK